jgi:enoyl-CoA hydratase/carnithine racemase
MKGGMDDEDLEQLGDVLGHRRAGLIVVYAVNMDDQIAANVKAVNRAVSKEVDANADELAKELNEAEKSVSSS